MYIHMLGYPTHFGQMETLKLIASSGFPEKVGATAAAKHAGAVCAAADRCRPRGVAAALAAVPGCSLRTSLPPRSACVLLPTNNCALPPLFGSAWATWG